LSSTSTQETLMSELRLQTWCKGILQLY